MFKGEIKKLLHKKSLLIMTILTFLLPVFWGTTCYQQGTQLLSSGSEYAESGLAALEVPNIFLNYMLQMALSIYIFPVVISAVLFVIDDIREHTTWEILLASKNKWKFLRIKILLYFGYTLMTTLLLAVVTTLMSLAFDQVHPVNSSEMFHTSFVLGFVLNWLGISILGLMTIAITYLFRSAIAGSGCIVYIMLERLFTSTTAISGGSERLMRLNGYLPWANLNSLFVYAGNLKDIFILNDSSSYVYLSMYRATSDHGALLAMPYFKDLSTILIICLMYAAVFGFVIKFGYSRSFRHI